MTDDVQSGKFSLGKALKVGIAFLVSALLVKAAVENWAEIKLAYSQIATLSLTLGFVFVAAGILAGVQSWLVSLRGLGQSVPTLVAYSINLVGQLGKYIPGSIWSYVFQMELGRPWGISRARMFLSSIVFLAITMITGTLVGAEAIPYANTVEPRLKYLIAITLLGLPFLHSGILTGFLNLILKTLGKPKLEQRVNQIALIKSVGWGIVAWLLLGSSSWILINSFASPKWEGLLFLSAISAIAIVAGQLAFFIPSGLGVREAILIAGFQRYVSYETALATALISRALFTSADIFLAGIFWAISRKSKS